MNAAQHVAKAEALLELIEGPYPPEQADWAQATATAALAHATLAGVKIGAKDSRR